VSADDFVVLRAHKDLLIYVDSLQKKNAEALSFYPKQVFEREAEKGRIFLGLLNGQPCGYLYAGAQRRDVKLHQVCIEYDARRRLYGAMIVSCMEEYAEEGKATSITLRCGFDLEANGFWGDLGYKCIQHQKGGVRRLRTINVWRKWLQEELFITQSIEPAIGKTDSSVWRKNKKTGIVTGFSRGKKMQDYRAILEAENDNPK
jgi:hypothetical protein|tara:strand:- start:71 stop:679 length:609 start_codon:yes stop_codon:yes gene_type:complete